MNTDEAKPPPEIWIQWHGDGHPADQVSVSELDVTWSREKIFDSDLRYIFAPVHDCKCKTFRRQGTYDEVWGLWDAVQECDCGKRRFGKCDEHGNFGHNTESSKPAPKAKILEKGIDAPQIQCFASPVTNTTNQ